MSKKPKAGTPITQEFVLTAMLGYFVGGPLLMLLLLGLWKLAMWIF